MNPLDILEWDNEQGSMVTKATRYLADKVAETLAAMNWDIELGMAELPGISREEIIACVSYWEDQEQKKIFAAELEGNEA
jgi:uncharacterized protein (DUF433 family)